MHRNKINVTVHILCCQPNRQTARTSGGNPVVGMVGFPSGMRWVHDRGKAAAISGRLKFRIIESEFGGKTAGTGDFRMEDSEFRESDMPAS